MIWDTLVLTQYTFLLNADPELALLSEGSAGRPPLTQQSKVSFAEGTNFQKDRSCEFYGLSLLVENVELWLDKIWVVSLTVLTSQGNRSHSQASAFDENTLNLSQFMHLIETFLGDIVDMDAFTQLVRFIREGYMETEEERMARLVKVCLHVYTY